MTKIKQARLLKARKRTKLDYSEMLMRTVIKLVNKGVLTMVRKEKKSKKSKIIDSIFSIFESVSVIALLFILGFMPQFLDTIMLNRLLAFLLMGIYLKMYLKK